MASPYGFAVLTASFDRRNTMNPQRLRSLFRRRNLFILSITLLSSLAIISGFASGTAQSPAKEEREVEDKIPKHLPIKVKIKKPEKLKDSQNEDWPDNVEIEVTNTGTKPIYYLNIALSLPDVIAENGLNYGYRLRHGRIALADFGEPVQPSDLPILPGESVTIKLPGNDVKWWKEFGNEGRRTNPKKLVFEFQEINYGDGTGFLGTSGTPMPIKKERSSNTPRGQREQSIGGTAQSPEKEEREVEDKIPKHLPIKVKIKKPEKLKDSQNGDWFSDLEVEVTNTGSKPIYFLSIALSLPDVLAEDGRSYGYKLHYGRVVLADFGEPVRPDDVPIRPGESVIVKGHINEVEGWKRFRAKGKVTNPIAVCNCV
jgi:hypothetical protein